MSCCASTPSAGPRPLSAGIRSCVVARPRSIFRTRSPSTRRSPDSGAASAVIPGTSGVASGEIPICSIGALSQNGEIGSSSSSGSAQASNPQRDAARSARRLQPHLEGRLLRRARLRMAAAPFRPVCRVAAEELPGPAAAGDAVRQHHRLSDHPPVPSHPARRSSRNDPGRTPPLPRPLPFASPVQRLASRRPEPRSRARAAWRFHLGSRPPRWRRSMRRHLPASVSPVRPAGCRRPLQGRSARNCLRPRPG